jgi:hypothetical protein
MKRELSKTTRHKNDKQERHNDGRYSEYSNRLKGSERFTQNSLRLKWVKPHNHQRPGLIFLGMENLPKTGMTGNG